MKGLFVGNLKVAWQQMLLLIVMTLCLSLVFSGVGFAQMSSEDVDSELERLANQYNVKFRDVVGIPEGVTPIEYGSIEELEKDLIKQQEYVAEQEALMSKALLNRCAELDLDSVNIQASGYQDKAFPLGALTGLPPVSLNIGVDYTYSGNQFLTCTGIDSWLTGFQFPIGYGWEQTSASHSIIDGRHTLAVTVRGTVDWYLIIQGGLKMFTHNHSQYAEFWL